MRISRARTAQIEAVGEALRVAVVAANRFRYAVAREDDLGLRDAALLAFLRDAGGQLTPGALAQRLLVTSGTLTAILRRLEARKMVARSPHPDDQRAIIVALSPGGWAVADRGRDHLRTVAEALLANPELDAVTVTRSLHAAAAGLTAEALTAPRPVG